MEGGIWEPNEKYCCLSIKKLLLLWEINMLNGTVLGKTHTAGECFMDTLLLLAFPPLNSLCLFAAAIVLLVVVVGLSDVMQLQVKCDQIRLYRFWTLNHFVP